jgi:ATP-binding cassette subfamily F protein 3
VPGTDPQTSRRRKKLAALEDKLQGLATERTALEKQLGSPGAYMDQPAELARLTTRHAAVIEAHEALEAEWLALYEQLEAG